MTSPLETSYDCCSQTARRSASNFYWSFRLLPRLKRRSMCALYAFSRHTDDLADSDEPVDARRAALVAWREALNDAFAGQSEHPLLPALVDTVRRYSIPRRHLYEIIDGVEMDLHPSGFATFDQLCDYCHLVASSVGIACIHIWGFSDNQALQQARDCGIAFQLTNILRDVHEDAVRDRVYIPREDFARFECSVDDFKQDRPHDRLAALMLFEIDRAESYYHRGLKLVDFLHSDGRRVLRLMMATYWHLLRALRHRTGNIGGARLRVSRWSRVAIAGSALLPWGSVYRGTK